MGTQGVKLRTIASSAAASNPLPHALWSLPFNPAQFETLAFYNVGPPAWNPAPGSTTPMLHVDINEPGVTGYSVCYSRGPLCFRAHRPGDDLSFYRDYDGVYRQTLWIYMPVDPGELVTEIWRRDVRIQFDASLVVSEDMLGAAVIKVAEHLRHQMRTNRGRTIAVGPTVMPSFLKPTWHQVCGPLAGPTRVFFDHSLTARGMGRCAMWAPGEPSGQAPPLLYANGSSWYYSDASLEGVVEITPCRWHEAGQQSHSKIIGLLLRYSNGSRACLGEFRLDCASTPLLVGDTEKLRLGFNLTHPLRLPYLAEIRFSPPPAPSDWEPDEQWLEIPWKETLQWWFVRNHCCRIVYGDMASPRGLLFPLVMQCDMRSSIE